MSFIDSLHWHFFGLLYWAFKLIELEIIIFLKKAMRSLSAEIFSRSVICLQTFYIHLLLVFTLKKLCYNPYFFFNLVWMYILSWRFPLHFYWKRISFDVSCKLILWAHTYGLCTFSVPARWRSQIFNLFYFIDKYLLIWSKIKKELLGL